MGWNKQEQIPAGSLMAINITGGVYLDPIGNISEETVREQVAASADGWSIVQVKWVKGFFGIGDKLLIFGRAEKPVFASAVGLEVSAALNAFWEIAGASAVVYVGDNLATPLPDDAESWTGTVQLVAIAVIVVAVVWGISETRKILK